MQIPKRCNLILFISGILLLIITLLGFAPRTIDLSDHNTEIIVNAQPGMVVAPGSCTFLSWSVGYIQTIYLNDQPTTGSGQQSVCIDPASPPTFTITFPDDTEEDYAVEIPVLIYRPFFWVSLLLIIVGMLRSLFKRRDQASAKLSPRLRNVLLVFSSVILSLGVLEIGLRFLIDNYGSEDAQIMYLFSLDDIRRLDDRLIPMPYINYLAAPQYDEHNSLGYRGGEIELPKPEGVYRIVALGGSTTYSTGTTAEESYPALLQQILRENYGYEHVEVINAGFIGYSSWESVVNLAFRVLELEPDHIIHYAAINDLVPREQLSTDCYRGENALRGLNGTSGFWTERATPLSSSALHRLIAINLGWMENPLALRSAFNLPQADCQNDGGISIQDRVALNEPVYFERNLRSLIGIANAHDIEVLLSTWVYYVDGEQAVYWREAIAEHNAITQSVAADMNKPVIDLAADFPVDESYWEADGVHMLADGTRQQAERYAAFLVDNDLIPSP